jgi:hypothetical protein
MLDPGRSVRSPRDAVTDPSDVLLADADRAGAAGRARCGPSPASSRSPVHSAVSAASLIWPTPSLHRALVSELLDSQEEAEARAADLAGEIERVR